MLATSEYNVYYILPALTATSENYLYCIPPFSAPVRALLPFQPIPGPTPILSTPATSSTLCVLHVL